MSGCALATVCGAVAEAPEKKRDILSVNPDGAVEPSGGGALVVVPLLEHPAAKSASMTAAAPKPRLVRFIT